MRRRQPVGFFVRLATVVVAPMSRLVVVPDSDRVEQWILDASRRQPWVDLRGVCTLADLLARCEPESWAQRRVVEAEVLVLACVRLAPRHVGTSFGDGVHRPEFARQALELFTHLRGQGATPRLLEEAANRLDDTGSVGARAHGLASLWRALETWLEERRWIDAGSLWAVATERLRTDGLPAGLRGLEAIEVRHLHDVPPARVAFLQGLAEACTKTHVEFSWRYPASGNSSTDAFIVEAVREAEARWQQLEVGLAPWTTHGPLEHVAPVCFDEQLPVAEATSLTAFSAPSPRDEAREIARRVRKQLLAGVPPEAIGIAFRDLASDTEELAEALSEAGIPWRARLGVPLARSVLGRVALDVLRLEDDGFPSEDVAALLEHPSVTVLADEASEPRKTFALAAVRDDVLGGGADGGAFHRRLKDLEGRAGDRARHVGLLRSATERVLEWCRTIPAHATAHELLEAWWEVLTRLGMLQAQRSVPTPSLSPTMEHEVEQALARDQAAVDALVDLLSSLKSALERSGFGRQPITRVDFARWVSAFAGDVNLEARGARTGAVWLLDVRELPGRTFAQLFLGGLQDGRFPGRPVVLDLLSERERVELNRAAGKPLFRTSVGEGEVRLPVRLAEDRLLFHVALSSAASVTVSRARADDRGREVLASPFHEALGRRVTGFHEETLARVPVPPLDEVQGEAELRVRVALEALGSAQTRQTPVDPRRSALAAFLSAEPWFERARHMAAMERERLIFFSDSSREPGAYSGRIDGAALAALDRRLDFDAMHPVGSSELSAWGTCAFKGLAQNVLKLRPVEAGSEDLDPRVRGDFWHQALERLVPELERLALLGSSGPRVRAVIQSAVDQAAERMEQRSAVGHPALWSVAREWAVQILERMMTSPHALPFGVTTRPKYYEVPFGSPKAPPELQQVRLPAVRPGERDVHFGGRIDRIDVGEGVVAVLDYKSTINPGKRSEEYLVTEFQLPLYLYAVRSLLPDVRPTGGWLGVKKNEHRAVPDVEGVKDLLATDELSRARAEQTDTHNLANAVFSLLANLRRGDFGARPYDCEMCQFLPVCRISQRRLEDNL